MAPFRLRCGANDVVDIRQNAQQTIARMAKHEHRLAYIGQAFFYDETRALKPCPWSYLRLNRDLLEEVTRFQKHLPDDYLAVHLRSMSGSCKGRQLALSKRLNMASDVAEQYRRQCEMTTDYVLSFHSATERVFFLATDDQNPKATKELTQAGAVRYSGKYNPKSIPAILMDLWLMALSPPLLHS